MQLRQQQGTTFRVQRDGPSPSEQATDAMMQEFQAELVAASARIQALVASGAENTPAGRAELREARKELTFAAQKVRALADEQRAQAIAEAAAGGPGAGRTIVGRQGGVTISTTGAPPRNDDIPDIPPNVREVSMLFIVCMAAAIVLAPLMRAFGRLLERRTPQQHLPPEILQQLTRMEQAIETIAVEVERVSEGQRFATKLLAERERSAVDAGSR